MNKIKKILAISFCVMLLTGCTKYKSYEKQPVTNSETGQRIVENILCKTDETEKQYISLKEEQVKKLEEKLNNGELSQEDFDNKKKELDELFDISDVTLCSEFKITSGKEGLWETVFVKTLSFVIIKLGELTKNYGWAIMLVTLLIRLFLFPVTKKTAMQSENMKAAQPKLEKLEQKYRNRNDQQSQIMKSQEMLKIYKDYDINPLSSCLFAFLQIPLFFAFYEALYRLPVVLEESFFGINLGLTPSKALSLGQWYYLIFVVLIIVATYFSFKLNSATNDSSPQADQMKMMTNFSVIMISIAAFQVSTGIALYWIVNSSFTIVQNLLVKRGKKNVDIR